MVAFPAAPATGLAAIHTRVLDTMVEGVTLANEHGVILYTNPAGNRMFGYAAGELIGRHVSTLIASTPEDNAHLVSTVMETVRTTGEWEGEFTNLKKDGARFTSYARVTLLELDGKPHFLTVREDITERRRLEERARRMQALSVALSRAVTPGDVAGVAVDQGVAAAGARTAGLWRLSRGGDSLELLASANFRDEALEELHRVALADASVPIAEAVRSREPVWVTRPESASAILPLLVERRVVGGLTFGFVPPRRFDEQDRDFLQVIARQCALALERAHLYEDARVAEERSTFLARASEVLNSSLDFEDTLRTLTRLAVGSLADFCAVDLADDEGGVRRVAVAHLDAEREHLAREYHRRFPVRLDEPTGVGRVIRTGEPEFVTELPEELIDATIDDPMRRAFVKALGIRSYASLPLKARDRVLGALTLIYAESDRRYDPADLPLVQDLARRAAIAVDNALLFREAQQLRRNAEEASRAKDEFLATLSHELRTPLTSILGWAQILRATKAPPPSKVEKGLQTIERNARAQAQLIEDLLDVSRIIRGKMRLEVAPLDPAQVIDAALESVRPAAEAKELELVTTLDREAGPVMGDAGRIQQVVWNLLTNAIKFTPRGGRIELSLRRLGEEIAISVADTGKGLAPEFMPHLFERFRQADATTTRAHGGLGLGLAIVRHLVELHGGSVAAYSGGEGKGSTFRVQLPMAAAVETALGEDEGQLPARRPKRFRSSEQLAGARVLLVDDEHDTLEFLRAVVESSGGFASTADSAAEAFAAIERERPDVIVSDIGMPGEDGLQLLAKVRALPAQSGGQVPAIALTAYARAEDKERVLRGGFQKYIRKPVDPLELIDVLSSLTGRAAREA